jgi:2-polyprenyl-3-methyl-5-hydroxy-6-metoxy-1,4-benzoquinol methylase
MALTKYKCEGFNKVLSDIKIKKIFEFIKGDSCLELGCGEGTVTKELVKKFKEVVAVDIDAEHVARIPKFKNLKTVVDNVETLDLGRKFDTIVTTHVLEHVSSASNFLATIRKHAHKDTIIVIVIPNAFSVNRLIGVDLGMIPAPNALDKQDVNIGHKRMLGIGDLALMLKYNDFNIKLIETYVCKPLPNSVMMELPKKIVKQLVNMKVKALGADIFAVCSIKNE